MTKDKKEKTTLKVKQVGSPIRRNAVQKLHLKGLGLGKMSAEVVVENNSTNQGLIRKVRHMVQVIEG